MGRREFPETDVTKYVLRTTNAPLSASGTHEVVASAVYKGDLERFASRVYGRQWRYNYEVRSR